MTELLQKAKSPSGMASLTAQIEKFPIDEQNAIASRWLAELVGLKQKSTPNQPQTSFVSGKHFPIVTEPLEETKRYRRLKCF